MPLVYKKNLTVRRTSPRAVYLTIALTLVFVAASFFLGHRMFGNAYLVPFLASPLLRRELRPKQALVAASSTGLRIGDAWFARAQLRSSFVRHDGQGTSLVVRGKNMNTFAFAVADEAEADVISHALSLDAASTSAEFALYMRESGIAGAAIGLGAGTLALMIAILGALTRAGPVVLGGGIALLTAGIIGGAVAASYGSLARIVVGADGLAIRHGFRKAKFYPHDAIARVDAEETALTITLKNGKVLRYFIVPNRSSAAPLTFTAASVAARIAESREVRGAFGAGAAAMGSTVLARGGRSAREWLTELRRAGEGALATFRDAALTRDELLGLAESPDASPRDRLAAVAAVRVSAVREDESPRLRVAAERCALPALREGIEEILDAPDEEAIARALDAADVKTTAAMGEERDEGNGPSL